MVKDSLSGDMSLALASISTLRIRACTGLFSDLDAATRKRVVLRVYDRATPVPFEIEGQPVGLELSLADIFDRLPDIHHEPSVESPSRRIRMKDLEYSPEAGAKITVHGTPDHPVCLEYANAGYKLSPDDDPYDDSSTRTILSIDDAGFRKHFPQLLEARINRTRDLRPSPHLVSKFSPDSWLSQISVTYMVSYVLGMLARYYPTHWSALMSGEKGDAIWPDINAAQSFVEASLPELVLKVIGNSLFEADDEIDRGPPTDELMAPNA